MSTKQSSAFKGLGRLPLAVPHKAGETVTVIFTHIFKEAVATTDVLELLPIPANMKLVKFDYATENVAALNMKIGIMSGKTGDVASARTLGAELFAAAPAATPTEAPLLAVVGVGAADENRSIGITPATDIAAGNTKKLHVRMVLISA